MSYERADLLKDADHVVGTPDFPPGSYMDALGVVESVEAALRGEAS